MVGCAIFGVSPIDETEEMDPDYTQSQDEAVYAPPTNTPNSASSLNADIENPHTAIITPANNSVEENWANNLETDQQLMSSNNYAHKGAEEQGNSVIEVPPPQIDLLDDIKVPLPPPDNDLSIIEPTASEVADLD